MDWTNINNYLPKADHAYDPKTIESISKNRKDLNNTLFFDRVCHNIGLSPPSKLYPPKTSQDLHSLWSKIVSLERPEESKQALLFYLLRDLRHGKTQSQPDIKFANAVFLPRSYQIFMSGLWELDHLHFSESLEYLTHPMTGAEFVDEIFELLATHPRSTRELAMGYYHAKSPSLHNERLLDAYFGMLVEANGAEALDFARGRVAQHRRLFEGLVHASLAEGDGDGRKGRVRVLVGLPLSGEEEGWLEEYLGVGGEGAGLDNAMDVLVMRRIARSVYSSEQSELGSYHGSSIDGVTWEDVKSGL